MSDDVPFRILPRISDRNRHFWTGGVEGELRFLRCQDDGTYVHPPTPRCPKCHGNDTERWLEARKLEMLPCPYFHVTVTVPGFFTPRIDMQRCSASMTTSTPRGRSTSAMASAICVVIRSWTWRRRA